MFGRKQITQQICKKLLPEIFYKFEVQREINKNLLSDIDNNAIAIAELQKELDDLHTMFITHSVRGRNVNKESDDATRQE